VDRPFVKVIPPGSYVFDAPVMQHVKVASDGRLHTNDLRDFVKRAGYQFAHQIRDLNLKAGDIPVHILAIGASEHYGCFPAGTPVQTEEGHKNIEDVALGDMALTHRNRYRPVTSLYRREYSGTMIGIKAACLPVPLKATANHPIQIVRKEDFARRDRAPSLLKVRKGKPTKLQMMAEALRRSVFVRADEVRRGDFLVIPCAPNEARASLANDMAYSAGLYTAEACPFHRTRPTKKEGRKRYLSGTVFSLSREKDAGPLARLREFAAASGYKVGTRPSNTSDKGLRASLTWKSFAATCLDISGEHATKKFISPAIFSQTDVWKKQFLAGYFDGDGHLARCGHRPRYENTLRGSTASLNLALDVQRLLASLQIPSAVCKLTNREKNGCFGRGDHTIYEINVGAAHSEKIFAGCARLTPRVRTKKRFSSANGHTNGAYLLVPVRAITAEEVTTTVYNIEVAEDHTYVTLCAVGNSNRNGDIFEEAVCRNSHGTFPKYAKLFRDHRNKDPEKSYGYIKASGYNETMHRIELLGIYNGTKEAARRNGGLLADLELEKLASGTDFSGSMACRVPYDICTSCGNKARNRDEYCRGVDEGGTCPDGGLFNKIATLTTNDDNPILAARNIEPVFFDYSKVARGADRTSFVIGNPIKAASAVLLGGAALAEEWGVTAPRYLEDTGDAADMYKIACKLASIEESLGQQDRWLLAFRERPRAMWHNHGGTMGEALASLAMAKVAMPVDGFVAMVNQSVVADGAADPVRECMPGIFSRLVKSGEIHKLIDENPFVPPGDLPPLAVRRWANAKSADFSVDPAVAEKRLMRNALYCESLPRVKQASYASNGPAQELAKHYASYQLAFLSAIKDSPNYDLTAKLCVVQNHV